MPDFVPVGNSKTRYKLFINPDEYSSTHLNPTFAPLRAEIILIDHTQPVYIDTTRIMTKFDALRAKDFKYYFYLLNLLVRNDEVIRPDQYKMRNDLKDKYVQNVADGIKRLVQQGLIFAPPNTRGSYLINPAYAWKGNRLDYLDKAAFKNPDDL